MIKLYKGHDVFYGRFVMAKHKNSKIEVRMELLEKELVKIQSQCKNVTLSDYVRELIFEDLKKNGLITTDNF